MLSRLVAGGVLLASGGIAWLALAYVPAARALQAAIGLSMLYVGYLALRGWQVMRRDPAPAAGPGEGTVQRPWVTVVVPAANEAVVIGDLVADVTAQEYGDQRGPRFDLLVVDDGSDDGTGDLASVAAAGMGERVAVVRRPPGSQPATKGAAMAFAHEHVGGEIVCVLDADTRLAPDFLARAMAAWQADPSAAALQVQRRAENAGGSWLAGAQDEELMMDMASQCGRWATDGTAELRGSGMLVRRSVLEALGGWPVEAITEDLELSTRLTVGGHHVALAPRVQLHEESLEHAGPLWRQRMRWAEGSMRRLMELGPGLLADARLPIGRRLDFLLFVTEFVVPPLFVASIVASGLTAIGPRSADWTVPVSLFLGYGLGTFLLALAGLAAHGARGLRLLGRATRGAFFLSHWLVVVPAALLKITLLPPTRRFVQTPRHGRTRA
jgi:1,2-diacylglycerol 3-beta-glucosyltransferase